MCWMDRETLHFSIMLCLAVMLQNCYLIIVVLHRTCCTQYYMLEIPKPSMAQMSYN